MKTSSLLKDSSLVDLFRSFQLFLYDNKAAVITWILFLSWFAIGVVMQMILEENSFSRSFYTIISMLSSTGSIGPITNHNKYAIIFSFYNISGVFLLSLSFVYYAYEIKDFYLNIRLQKCLKKSIILEEIQELKEIEIIQNQRNENNTIELSKHAYIIGIALRLELIDPSLIDKISQNYEKNERNKIESQNENSSETSEYSRLIT